MTPPRLDLAGLRRTLGPHAWTIAVVAVYVVLVLGGITQSSIGIPGLRADADHEIGTQVGGAVGIRSDEYLTSTPLLLGVEATGEADDLNPLTAPQGFLSQIPVGPVSTVVLADGAVQRLGPWLPDAMLLAARWWLPFLLIALGMPSLFASLTGSRTAGMLVAVACVAAPASAWWSWTPVSILGFTSAGAAAMLRAADAADTAAAARAAGEAVGRRRLRVVGWGALAALLLARTPLHYQPWSIVLALSVLATVVASLLARADRRRALLTLAGVGGAALVLAAAVVVENLASVRATMGTVYPGARSSAGGPNPVPDLFGATSLADLKNLEVVGSNASEISSGYAVAAVWALLLLVAGVVFRDRVHRVATMVMLACTSFWFVWSMVDFGSLHLPLVSMVPPNRSGDVVGYLGVLLLGLVLPGLVRTSWRLALASAATVALLAAWAGSLLRAGVLPGLGVASIWLSSAVLGVVVLLVTRWPRRPIGYAVGVLGAAALVATVNPVLVGTAELRAGAPAQAMLEAGAQARAAGEVWATDDPFVDALLTATGVPSLSGRQLSGPDVDGWRALDPGEEHRDVWNRGGSFVRFAWTDDETLTFANPTADVILVTGSPCALAEREPGLSTVVSSTPLDGGCLAEAPSFEWGGITRHVYTIRR